MSIKNHFIKMATKPYQNNKAKAASQDALEGYVFGKVQPQALALEEVVLGALMIENGAMDAISDIISAESFYTEQHQQVYKAICKLYNDQRPIDLLTVTEALRQDGKLEFIGGAYTLVELTNRVASSANIEYHARIIQQKAMLRALIKVSSETMELAYDETVDVIELIEQVSSSVFKIAGTGAKRVAKTMADLTMSNVKKTSDTMKSGGVVQLSTGLRDVDKITGGLHNSDLTILAARPGMGKTAMILTEAVNLAESGKRVMIFSLEMSAEQLNQRILSMYSGVTVQAMRTGQLSQNDFEKVVFAAEKVRELPIVIDDTAGIKAGEIRAKARREKLKNGLDAIYVDYIQLMGSEAGVRSTREQEVSKMSQALKGIAKDIDVPVIALSQLSRAVEMRGGTKRPMLSDLRDSGSIEQDADVVKFLYRPDYYGILEDDEGNNTKGLTEVIFAKNRSGGLDTVFVSFIETQTRFVDRDSFTCALHLLPNSEPIYLAQPTIERPDSNFVIPF